MASLEHNIVVMVVEDEPDVRSMAFELLEFEGFEVLDAEHAAQAIEILACHASRVHALFSDVNMPGEMDGVMLAHHVRLEPLKAAERLWLQYRAANCNFYGSAEGSIRELEGAECMRAMTEDRAKELGAAAHE